MLNTPEFGRLVKQFRGTRSQTELAEKADTFRQRFGAVENGQPHDLSDAALAQLDTAFDWPTGYAKAALWSSHSRPDDDRTKYTPVPINSGPFCLGYFEDGSPVETPGQIASTAPADAFVPALAAAGRTTLVDTQGLSTASRYEFMALAGNWRAITGGTRVGGVGVFTGNGYPFVAPVAVDPIPGITSLSQAQRMAQRAYGATYEQGGDESLGLSLLAASIELQEGDVAVNGLDPRLLHQSQKPRPDRLGGQPETWPERLRQLISQAGLTEEFYRYVAPHSIFPGLFRSRDSMIDVLYNPCSDPSLIVQDPPTVVAAQDLSQWLLFFDSSLTPELPVVVHDALVAAGHVPPVVILHDASRRSGRALVPVDFSGTVILVNPDQPTMSGPGQVVKEAVRDAWSSGHLKYATVTDFNSQTRRAVYTHRGQSFGLDLPTT